MKMKRWQLLWSVYELSLKWRRLRLRIEKRVEAFTLSMNENCDEVKTYYAIHKCMEQMTDSKSTEARPLVLE